MPVFFGGTLSNFMGEKSIKFHIGLSHNDSACTAKQVTASLVWGTLPDLFGAQFPDDHRVGTSPTI